MSNLRIFGLGPSQEFAAEVAKHVSLGVHGRLPGLEGLNGVHRHQERYQPDGEVYTTSMTNVRGCDVFVVSSLYGDERENVNDRLMKVLLFINTLRHASAARVTLVAPYLCYMRQDRKTESRAPIATQAVAMMLEAVGLDRLLTMDVHNLGAEQNAFRVPIDNLEARKPLADAVARELLARKRLGGSGDVPVKLLTPDVGGVARTKLFQHSLAKRLGCDVGIAYVDKTRVDAHKVEVCIIGDVAGCLVIVVDDMITTGGTVGQIQEAVSAADGVMWGVAATHGLMVDGASDRLANIPRIYVTDTVHDADRRVWGRARVVSTVSLFAEAIRRIHNQGGSISELLDD